MSSKKTAEKLLKFIENSPSCFHAVKNCAKELEAAGYKYLPENEKWNIKLGEKYYTTRNESSLIAFNLPKKTAMGFHMISAHSDSPTFRLKENPEMSFENHYVRLNVEKYGGMLMSTWFDRPLSIAGRAVVKKDGKIESRLVNIDSDLCVIPSLAIHMNRMANKGVEYNPQVDLIPLFGSAKADTKNMLAKLVAKSAGVKADEVLTSDLFLYVRDKGRIFGENKEFILSPKLDDLQSVFCGLEAMTASTPEKYIALLSVFDNEEVGSVTKQGSDSTFLSDVTDRICDSLKVSDEDKKRMISSSFMISSDNAHAVHPNHPEKADPTNRPYLNGGIVLKYNGSQKYATDAVSGAVLKDLCARANVPCQVFFNRSDIEGGHTLGNISTSHVSVPTADIGLPQLAMHSAVETGGVTDCDLCIPAFKLFYTE